MNYRRTLRALDVDDNCYYPNSPSLKMFKLYSYLEKGVVSKFFDVVIGRETQDLLIQFTDGL